MSLNKFTSQASPNASLNPRVNSLVVDGKMSNGALVYPSADNGVSYMKSDGAGNLSLEQPAYGSNGYFNAGAVYNVTAIPTFPASKIVSGNSNISNASNKVTLNADGITINQTGKYLITAHISFASVTLPSLLYVLAIGVNGNLSNRGLSQSSANQQQWSVSEVRSCSSGDLIKIFLQTGALSSDIDVSSWTLAVKQVS